MSNQHSVNSYEWSHYACIPFCMIFLFALSTDISAQSSSKNSTVLDEVVVSAGRLPGESVDVNSLGGRVEVIKEKEINRESSQTVAEFLGDLPGFTLRDQGGNEFDQVLSARGFANGEDVLVMVDGVRFNKFGNNGVDWQVMPDLSSVKRIEVVYGPSSSIYGEGAQSAVVNIITRKSQKGGSVSYTGGSFAHHEGSLAQGFELGNWTTLFQIRALDRHGFRTNADANIQNGAITLNRDLGKESSIGFQGVFSESKVGAPNAITDTEIRRNGYDYTAPNNRDDFREIGHDLYKLSYENLIGSARLEVNYSHQRRETFFRTTSRVFGTDSVTNALQTVDGVQGILNGTDSFGGIAHNWTVGYEYNDTKQDRRNINGRDEKETSGFFLQDRLNVTDRLQVSGGVRFDDTKLFLKNTSTDSTFHRDYNIDNFRGSVTYEFFPKHSVFAQFGESFMPPNFGDIFAFSGPFQSNPDIKPERSDQWQGGLRANNSNYEWTVNYFLIETEDEIRYNTTTRRNENLAETERKGFEVSGQYILGESIELSGQLTTFNATIEKNPASPSTVGNNIPMVPDYRSSGTVNYALNDSLDFSVDGLYVDEQFVASDNENEEPKLSSYDVWNVQTDLQITSQGSIQLSVKNVLDENYSSRAVVSGSPPPFGAFPTGTIFKSPAPERHAEISVDWRF